MVRRTILQLPGILTKSAAFERILIDNTSLPHLPKTRA
jgi:hypothetical protein